MQTLILCTLLTISLPIAAKSIAAADKKESAEASSSATASPKWAPIKNYIFQSSSLQIQLPGNIITDHNLSDLLHNQLRKGKIAEIIEYFDKNPKVINSINDFASNRTFFESLLSNALPADLKLADYLSLVHYLLSKNVNVVRQDWFHRNALDAALNTNYPMPEEEHAKIIARIADLMLTQGTPLSDLSSQITRLEKEYKADLDSPLVKGYPYQIEKLKKKLGLVSAVLPLLEALAAQSALKEAKLPPELIGIVREYRVGGREQKQKAAEESEVTEGSEASKATGK